jgi:hypothetical protein
MKLTEIILQEGGAALKSVEIQRISREDIPATIHIVSKIAQVPVEDLHPLGSVGKTPDSGDIDLAIDVNKYDPQELHQRMCDQLGDDYCLYNTGTQVGSYAVPIAGDRSKGLVQVDFMFTTNPQWATFSYHSPGEASEYKGVVRAILLTAVAAGHQEPGTDYFEYDPESGEIIVRAGRTLDMGTGLRRIFQYRPRTQKGDKYLKSMKSIPVDEFKQMFPDVEVVGGEITITDPNKVLTILFGPGVKPKDVNTAEQVLDLITTRFDEIKKQEIYKKAAERLRGAKGKIKIPPEIMEHM